MIMRCDIQSRQESLRLKQRGIASIFFLLVLLCFSFVIPTVVLIATHTESAQAESPPEDYGTLPQSWLSMGAQESEKGFFSRGDSSKNSSNELTSDEKTSLKQANRSYSRIIETYQKAFLPENPKPRKWEPILATVSFGITQGGIIGYFVGGGTPGFSLIWMRTDIPHKFPIRPFLLLRRKSELSPPPGHTPEPLFTPVPSPVPTEPVIAATDAATSSEAPPLTNPSETVIQEDNWREDFNQLKKDLVKANPQVDSENLKRNLDAIGPKMADSMNTIPKQVDGEWWIGQVYWEFYITASGDVVPGLVGVGGDIGFRLVWVRTMKWRDPALPPLPKPAVAGENPLTDLTDMPMPQGLPSPYSPVHPELLERHRPPRLPQGDAKLFTPAAPPKNSLGALGDKMLKKFSKYNLSIGEDYPLTVIKVVLTQLVSGDFGVFSLGAKNAVTIVIQRMPPPLTPKQSLVEKREVAGDGTRGLATSELELPSLAEPSLPLAPAVEEKELGRLKKMISFFVPPKTTSQTWALWVIELNFVTDLGGNLGLVTLDSQTKILFQFSKRGL
jgi:hypothetical protein